jgi:signal transduction histidine kinase
VRILWIFAVSFLFSFSAILLFIRKSTVLEARNRELDRAAKALVKRDLEFSDVRRKQEDQLAELDRAAKALVRRDLELLQLNDELQEMDRAKSHFVSVAAHQLRTPLSITKWTFRMLLGGDFGPLHEEQKKVIQRGFEVNEGMIRLVGDLLDVARIETGKFLYTFAFVPIVDVLEEVILANRESAEERRIKLTMARKGTGKIPPLWIDKENIMIALQNLFTNAINYTLPGGKIEVVYEKVEDAVKVSVKDTGVGIPKHQVGRIFEKFFRGDNVVRMQTQGTGLGLFIAASIIRAHKGRVGVESEEGKGSTFWFTLPLKI